MKDQKKYVLAAVALFCVLAAALTAVWLGTHPDVWAGEKHITVEVVHGDGSSAEFTYDTKEEYLGALLLEEGLIAGSQGTYGLYVDTVDGETADYDANGSWWKLSCNGEDSLLGVDSVPIKDGDRYTWSYTVG